jgi:four helix bundle protein
MKIGKLKMGRFEALDFRDGCVYTTDGTRSFFRRIGMATIERFEDMAVWEESRAFANTVYQVTASGRFAKDFALRDQIRKAAVSIPSNIAEGFERDRRGEFVQFLRYAKGSAGEVRSQLYHARDRGYIDEETFEELRAEVVSLSRQIQGFIQYLENNPR